MLPAVFPRWPAFAVQASGVFPIAGLFQYNNRQNLLPKSAELGEVLGSEKAAPQCRCLAGGSLRGTDSESFLDQAGRAESLVCCRVA
jgi:hypothetical protein